MSDQDPIVNKALFDKWARRTRNELLEALPAYIRSSQLQIVAYIERAINQAITRERAALYKYVGKEIARQLSTPELKELVGHLFEQEKGRQDPDAINVEVIDGLFTGSKAKRNKDGNQPD